MPRCPFCSYEGSEESFKLVKGPWKFRFYTVRSFECSKCHSVFNYYYGVSSRGKTSEYAIKIRPRGENSG